MARGVLEMVPLRIPDRLVDKLRQLRSAQLNRAYADEQLMDPVLAAEEVVILAEGFGSAIYLGLDGRVIDWCYDNEWLNMENEPPRETSDMREVGRALVVGSKKWGLPELLDLLPRRPVDGLVCATCRGQRWWTIPGFKPDGSRGEIVCPICAGLGWVHAEAGPGEGEDAVVA